MNLTTKRITACLVLMLLLSGLLLCQNVRWESLGPDGGMMQSLLKDPGSSNTLYSAMQGKPYRIVRSTDGGRRWVQISIINDQVLSFGNHPTVPSRLSVLAYKLGTDDERTTRQNTLYISNDGATTWITKELPEQAFISKVIFDPVSPTTIHATGLQQSDYTRLYFKSTDDGISWTNTVLAKGRGSANVLGIEPKNPNIIYIGGYALNDSNKLVPALYKSTNGGAHFTQLPLGITTTGTAIISDLVIDPTTTGRLFISISNAVYRSTDGGESWEKNSSPVLAVQRLWLDPNNSDHLFAAISPGIIESKDGGATWKSLTGKYPGRTTNGLVFESTPTPTVLVTNSAGIWRTVDGGRTWKASHGGILGTTVTALSLAPLSPNVLYSDVRFNALYKTTAAAKPMVAWKQLPVFYTCTELSGLLISENDPDKIIALEGGG